MNGVTKLGEERPHFLGFEPPKRIFRVALAEFAVRGASQPTAVRRGDAGCLESGLASTSGPRNWVNQKYFQTSATHFPFPALIRYIAGNLLLIFFRPSEPYQYCRPD
jgi:hypothetical protein